MTEYESITNYENILPKVGVYNSCEFSFQT